MTEKPTNFGAPEAWVIVDAGALSHANVPSIISTDSTADAIFVVVGFGGERHSGKCADTAGGTISCIQEKAVEHIDTESTGVKECDVITLACGILMRNI